MFSFLRNSHKADSSRQGAKKKMLSSKEKKREVAIWMIPLWLDDKRVNRMYSAPTKLRGVTEKSQTPLDAAAKSRYL
jgi:hypothetical protein